jgi:hypothetical protein
VDQYVWNGHIDMGKKSIGNPGQLTANVYNTLKEAFISFVNLTQVEGKTIPSRAAIATRLNTVINYNDGDGTT